MSWLLFKNSLLFAGLATLLALGAGLASGVFLLACGPRIRRFGMAVGIVTLALPPFLVANCWLDLLGQTGGWRAWLPVNMYDLRSAATVMGLLLWPIPMFASMAAWLRLEPEHFEVEPRLRGRQLLRHLLLPAAGPMASAAAVLVFVLALANFAIPALFQVRVFTAEIWLRFSTNYDEWGALQASLPVVAVPVLGWLWLRRREVSWPRDAGAAAPSLVRRRVGWPVLAVCGAIAVLVGTLAAAVPVVELVSSRRTWTALGPALAAGGAAAWTSGWLAGAAATLVTLGGVVCWRWRWGAWFWVPFLLPGVFVGLVLIWVLNRPGLGLLYPSTGLVVAALTIRYLGAGWHAAMTGHRTADADLADAVRLAGGSRWQVWRLGIWPQVRWPLVVGWYAVYLLSLWDVETLVLIMPPGAETLALRVFNLLHYGHNPQVNALCLILLGLALAPLLLGAGWRWLRELAVLRRPVAPALLGLFGLFALVGCSRDGTGAARLESRFFSQAEPLGTRGRGAGQFNKPRSLVTDRHDDLFVVDMTGRVQAFRPDGIFLRLWQMPQTDLGRPKGMGLDGEGGIIVVEPHYSRVNHFSPEGTLRQQWGEHGTNAGQLMMPRAVAVNSHGEIWICEYGATERVQRFSPDGRHLLLALGRFGTAPGEFNRAEGLGVDRQDRLYVADSCNHRIQVFDPDGKWLRSYGRAGSGLGEFSYPYDIRVDPAGNQFVCEFGNSRIQVFDAQDRPLEVIGSPGAAPGQFSNPWSLALDSAGDLYVADAGNHRVQKLRRRGAAGPGPSRTKPGRPVTDHASRAAAPGTTDH